MAKGKRTKTKDLLAELIQNELESQLARLVRKSRKKANKETSKLNDMLRLEYREGEGFAEAEIVDDPPVMAEGETLKKTEDSKDQEKW